MEHALIVNGQPLAIRRQPFRDANGIGHGVTVFDLWSKAEKLTIGLYEITKEPVPAGFVASDWTYELVGDDVIATPVLAELPPDPIPVTPELIADALFPAPTDNADLVLNTYYRAENIIRSNGVDYLVTRPFLHADPSYTITAYFGHVTVIQTTDEWVDGGSYVVNQEVTYLGRRYRCVSDHTAWLGAGWTPVAVPALWTDLGPV